MPAKSIKQQRFMGMVRRAQKTGQAASPEVAEVAASMKKKDAKDFASTKHKGLPMKKEEFINEEDYDRMKDRQMERGTFRPRSKPYVARSGGSQPSQPKKKGSSDSALDYVKKSIEAKYGKGAIMDTSKKKNEDVDLEEGKKGLWDNIHAKRKRGEKPAKPGDKDYPKTLNVEDTINERGDYWHPDPEKDRKLGGPGANQRAREDRADASKPKEDPKKLKKGESYMDYAKRQKGYTPTKKKEGLGSKIKRKLGLGESVMSFKQFVEKNNG